MAGPSLSQLNPKTPGVQQAIAGQPMPANLQAQAPGVANALGVPPAPTAPPPPADLTGGYEGKFQDALQTSRSDIQRQVGMAIDEINRQRGVAQQAIGALPGQINPLFDQSQAQLGQYAQGLTNTEKGLGLQGAVGGAAMGMAPFQAGLSMMKAARGADVPLLGSVANEIAQRQTGQATQTGQDLQSQADQEQRGYYEKMAEGNAQSQFDANATAAKDEAAKQAQIGKPTDYGPGEVDPRRGAAIATGDQETARTIRQSHDYMDATSAIRDAITGGRNPKKIQQVVSDYVKKHPNKPRTISVALSDLGIAPQEIGIPK